MKGWKGKRARNLEMLSVMISRRGIQYSQFFQFLAHLCSVQSLSLMG